MMADMIYDVFVTVPACTCTVQVRTVREGCNDHAYTAKRIFSRAGSLFQNFCSLEHVQVEVNGCSILDRLSNRYFDFVKSRQCRVVKSMWCPSALTTGIGGCQSELICTYPGSIIYTRTPTTCPGAGPSSDNAIVRSAQAVNPNASLLLVFSDRVRRAGFGWR